MPLHVELVSPERVLFTGEASMVIARTVGGGDIAFMPGHAPFLGALGTWTIDIDLTDGTREVAAVHGGFIEVSDDRVIILSDIAELASQIDIERARRAAEAAEKAAMQGEDLEAVAALARAHARLRAAGQLVE